MKTKNKPIRILLVDDHELFRTGIANLLDGQPDMDVVGEAEDGLEGHYRAVALKPDLILLDVNMPSVDGLEALELIIKDLPQVSIVMLTVQDEDEAVFQAIRGGAQGYILKNTKSEDFLRMLREIMRGEAALSPGIASRVIAEFAQSPEALAEITPSDADIPDLTAREREVISLVSEGLRDKEIASNLSLSVHTVKSHIRNILSKLQVKNRHAAAAYARQSGLANRRK